MDSYAIRTERLTKRFGATTALDSVSLEIPQGIVYGLLGPNGAGKTTMIRLLLGLIEPSDGTAEVLGYGTETRADTVRSLCGTLLEHTGVYERLTVRDNLEYAGKIWRLPAKERRARIDTLLEKFELSNRQNEQAGKLSKGMKQKLAIARAILHRPRLVFLDEPTSALDAVAAAALREDIASLAREEGVSVFLTTHNLTEAERLCARVGVIRSGRLIYDGTPDELRSGGGRTRIEIAAEGLGERLLEELSAVVPGILATERRNGGFTVEGSPGLKAASVVRFLVERGVEVEEVKKVQASLEEAFLELLKEGPAQEEER
jgi:ABC-2 type transport system ATP-binding protein